ncbi:hypothetical protein DU475_22995 [Rhodopseudomonas sp. WA056]|nr:hypothetical protein [Rhodopseudomonas sp. WA056]
MPYQTDEAHALATFSSDIGSFEWTSQSLERGSGRDRRDRIGEPRPVPRRAGLFFVGQAISLGHFPPLVTEHGSVRF